MLKYYAAIGRYELRKDQNGLQAPVLIANSREYVPSVSEMALWSLLLWHIKDSRNLKTEFEKKRFDMHICEDLSFEYYIVRLEKLGYIRSGSGYTAADALYSLMSPLYMIPATCNIWVKVCTFFHLMVTRHLRPHIAARVFRKDRLSGDERTVMRYAKQNMLSVAELICCIDQNLKDVSNVETIMDNIYNNDDLTCDNLPAYTRASYHLIPILQAVTNLYLKRMILLEAL